MLAKTKTEAELIKTHGKGNITWLVGDTWHATTADTSTKDCRVCVFPLPCVGGEGKCGDGFVVMADATSQKATTQCRMGILCPKCSWRENATPVPPGSVVVESYISNNHTLISYRGQGRGLNVKRLEASLSRGLSGNEEIVEQRIHLLYGIAIQ